MVGGHKIKVSKKSLPDDWGHFDHDDMVIALSLDHIKDSKGWVETLRHEMLEASLCIGGVGYGENYDQEQVVRCIENLFFPAWDKVKLPQ